MGLFINRDGHPGVFKNDATIVEQNQRHSKIDSLSEWMQEQQETSASLNRHIGDLEMLLQQQKKLQLNQLTTIRNHLNELHVNDSRHDQFEKNVTRTLTRLDSKQKEFHQMLVDERAVDKEFRVQFSESTKEIAERLEKVALANEEIAVKVSEQLDHQRQLSDQILHQEDAQKIVITRLDNQEGITEKMARQLDHLRSILYERTNFLTEKIENSYTMTTSYLSKLLMESEQPMARFLMNPKAEEKQKSSD
jgi:hypothetical protein